MIKSGKIKSFVSFIIAVSVILLSIFPAFASSDTDARLYNTYGNSMLFQQNEPATIAGTAKSGSEISCELLNSSGEVIKSAKSTAESDNTFAVSFDAPAGGYEEYAVNVYRNGVLFAALEDVVHLML